MITAVEIDELYYAEPIKTVTTPAAGLTGAEVATILKNAATKRVKNVHGSTHQSKRFCNELHLPLLLRIDTCHHAHS